MVALLLYHYLVAECRDRQCKRVLDVISVHANLNLVQTVYPEAKLCTSGLLPVIFGHQISS